MSSLGSCNPACECIANGGFGPSPGSGKLSTSSSPASGHSPDLSSTSAPTTSPASSFLLSAEAPNAPPAGTPPGDRQRLDRDRGGHPSPPSRPAAPAAPFLSVFPETAPIIAPVSPRFRKDRWKSSTDKVSYHPSHSIPSELRMNGPPQLPSESAPVSAPVPRTLRKGPRSAERDAPGVPRVSGSIGRDGTIPRGSRGQRKSTPTSFASNLLDPSCEQFRSGEKEGKIRYGGDGGNRYK